MINIAIFASGSGSNAQNIANYFKNSEKFKIKLIISNKNDAFVLKRAENLGIEGKFFPKEDFTEPRKLVDYLAEHDIKFVVLAGFLLKIPQLLIDTFPNRIVNIHPALLPKFGGKGMYGDNVHKAVVAHREIESGITIHYINENYDEGNIIFQEKCPVEPTDTFEDVANKVHALEYKYFPQVLEQELNKL